MCWSELNRPHFLAVVPDRPVGHIVNAAPETGTAVEGMKGRVQCHRRGSDLLTPDGLDNGVVRLNRPSTEHDSANPHAFPVEEVAMVNMLGVFLGVLPSKRKQEKLRRGLLTICEELSFPCPVRDSLIYGFCGARHSVAPNL